MPKKKQPLTKVKFISNARRQSVQALSHSLNFKKHKARLVKYIGTTGFLICKKMYN